MNTIRKTVLWVLVLVLVGTCAGGAYLYHVWNESDELLRQMVHAKLKELAPEWNVTIPRVQFDFRGRIHLFDCSLKGEDGSPLLDVAEIVLTVDSEKLADGDPVIHQVVFVRPRVNLVRAADGTWNYERLPPLTLPKLSTPECRIEQLSLALRLEHPAGAPATSAAFEDVNVQMIPSGKRQYQVQGTARYDKADELALRGDWQVDAKSWNVRGEAKRLVLGADVLGLVAEFSPEFRAGLARLGNFAGADAPDEAPPAAGPAQRGSPQALLARFGMQATADVQFRLTQWQPGAERSYKIALELLDGAVANPPIQYPLSGLRGRIDCDNQQIVFTDLMAHTEGGTEFRIDQGRIRDDGDRRPAILDLTITNLPLDERFLQLLPETGRRVYAEARPAGTVDGDLHLRFDGLDRWENECTLFARNCTLSHVSFPYRIEQVEGTVARRGDEIEVRLTGLAGDRPVKLHGKVKNPGPEAGAQFVIDAAGIPIDDKLRAACSPRFLAVLDILRAQGELDGRVRLKRPAGLGQKLTPTINGRLRNGSINCRTFPIAFTGVTGEFAGSGDEWEFTGFSGRHGAAEATASGTWKPDQKGRPVLDLQFSATGASFDKSLLAALPPEWKDVWQEINPRGGLDVAGTLLFSPGYRPRLTLEGKVTDGGLSLRSFPFALDEVQTEFGVMGDAVTIKSFSGRHEETRVRGLGKAALLDDGEWRLTFDELYVDDLEAGRPFRKALPPRLRAVVDAFDPRGKQSISGTIEFRGKKGGDYPVTAAWDTVTVYTGTTITAGVELKDMHGTAKFRGTWDGQTVLGDGRIELSSVKVLGYQLANVQGPVRIEGDRLFVGSPETMAHTDARPSGRPERLTARFLEGLLGLDADIDLTDPMRYRVSMTFKDGNLRRYAQLYMPGHTKLDGVMNGRIELAGAGVDLRRLSGNGQLVISPAALYELPVIVAIFKVLNFAPVDTTAFDQARFLFHVRDGSIYFDQIDLVGNAINLVGAGTVRFSDLAVNLNFLSTMGRTPVQIPLVRELLKGVTKGWVGVQVTGTLKEPRSAVVAVPQIQEAIRGMLGMFEPRMPRR